MRLSKTKKLTQRLFGLVEQLRIEQQDLLDTWEDRSEQWQESERGLDEEMRIEEIGGTIDGIDLALDALHELVDPKNYFS